MKEIKDMTAAEIEAMMILLIDEYDKRRDEFRSTFASEWAEEWIEDALLQHDGYIYIHNPTKNKHLLVEKYDCVRVGR